MSLYYINEGKFDLPDDWVDRTLHVFAPSDSPDAEWNIVVSRDEKPDGETLEDYVSRQLGEMPKALRQFKVMRDEETMLDGVPAREVETTWLGENGTLRQRQIIAIHKNRAIVFTLTVRESLYIKYANILDDMLTDFEFRRD
ncbi:MAG: DUF1795 domain-containing protein [Pyrinomonadaceae bacterium]|nr:DUF1795 domain-containing protein [Pyrinomonadaceae bacterium]